MNKFLIIIAALAVLAGACGAYYYFAYPPVALRHKTIRALNAFDAAVTAGDRKKAMEVTEQMMAETGWVKLSVQMPGQNIPTETEVLDKKQFISFLDNTLYSLKDYYFESRLRDFSLSKDRKSAAITFTANGGGSDIANYAGMPANLYFLADISCSGQVDFLHPEHVTLDNATCTVQIHPTIAAPGK